MRKSDGLGRPDNASCELRDRERDRRRPAVGAGESATLVESFMLFARKMSGVEIRQAQKLRRV